jgi:Transposase DDE domain
MPTLVGL